MMPARTGGGNQTNIGEAPALVGYVHIRNCISHTYLAIELVIPCLVALVPGWFILHITGSSHQADAIPVTIDDDENELI